MTGPAVPAVIPADDELWGWEPRTRYLRCDTYTRGQAKARVAWDEAEVFTRLRCKRVWLNYREITEEDANGSWMDDWRPGDHGWLECRPDDAGAVAWWEVTWPRWVSERAVREGA